MTGRRIGNLGFGGLMAVLGALACLLVAAASRTPAFAAPGKEEFHGQQFDIADPKQGGRGGQVYLQSCAGCHDAGLDRAPQRNMFPYMSPVSIYRTLTEGSMKPQGAGLSEADKIAVAEFLTQRKIGAAAEAKEPPVCKSKAAAFDFSAPPAFTAWGLQPANTRFAPAAVAGLDKAKASRLKLKWAVSFPDALQVRSQPALAGGAVFIGSHNGGVYALDRETGCARWTFQAGAEVRTGIVASSWMAGDRTARPSLYFGDIVGNVYAVDTQTGKLVWRQRADTHSGTTITAAPSLVGGVLYVSVSSLEGVRPADPMFECCTSRGAVVAYDAATGAEKWRTYMTDTPVFTGLNAKGARQFGPSGANVWNSPAVDLKRRQLYVGTAQNGSSPANDKSDAIVALDMDTGGVKWAYQGTAGDAMNLACVMPDKTNCPEESGPDFDFGAAVMLVTDHGGQDLVVGGQKSGVVHAVDPDTGKLAWRTRVGGGGMLGGVHFGMAANADHVFAPVNDAPDGRTYPDPPRPGVYALDLATGKPAWSALASADSCAGLKLCFPGYSQAITATPDLVLAGSVDGWLRIFDAQTGGLIWSADTKAEVATVNGVRASGGSFGGGSGPVVSGGQVFVSSGYSLAGSRPGNVLLVYEAQ